MVAITDDVIQKQNLKAGALVDKLGRFGHGEAEVNQILQLLEEKIQRNLMMHYLWLIQSIIESI